MLSGEISGHTGQKGRLQQSLITFNLPYPPEFRIHILDIPLERLTFQFLAQCKSALNAVKRDGGTKVIIRIKERTSTAII